MKRYLIAAAPIALALFVGQGLAQQTDPQAQPQQPKPVRPAPARLSFADQVKRNLQRVGATVDESKGTADMVVSNYQDPRGGKTTIVIVNDRRKSLVGFYIYNFGSLKNATNREEIYKYLLSANDKITIGSFFVDEEDDIGYKYMIGSTQALNQTAFDSLYLTMASVARERRQDIRQMLGLSTGKDEKPQDVKKAAEEKPPETGAGFRVPDAGQK